MENILVRTIKQLRWYDVCFVLLVCLSLTLKLVLFEYPLEIDNGEGSRDYIISHLIASYGEFPKYGPANGVFEEIGNSALYYYILSLPLFIYDSVWTNLALQMVSQFMLVALLYLLARRMFGGVTACLTVVFFAFSADFLITSRLVWQPSFMLPFLYASFLFLLYAYEKLSTKWLLFASAMLVTAVAIHNAAGAFLPMFILVAWCVAKRIGITVQTRVVIMLGTAALFVSYYTFNLMRLFKEDLFGLSLLTTKGHVSASDIVVTFPQSLQQSLTHVAEAYGFVDGITNFVHVFVACCICGIIASYFLGMKKAKHKPYVPLLMATAASFIVCIVLFGTSAESHYTVPAFGLLVILFSFFYVQVFSKTPILKVGGVLLLIPFLYVTSRGFLYWDYFLKPVAYEKNYIVMSAAIETVADSISQLQRENGYDDLNFFQVEGLRNGEGNVASSVFLVPLEKKLGQKLAKIDEQIFLTYNYSQVNADEYMYLFCTSNTRSNYSAMECLDTFLKNHNNEFEVVQEIFHSLKIKVFLTKKI